MKKQVTISAIFFLAALLTILFFSLQKQKSHENGFFEQEPEQEKQQITAQEAPKNPQNEREDGTIDNAPLKNWRSRSIKKPFGIEITPQNSPVQPERFSGFHTGIDFEIFENELNQEVFVRAICKGTVAKKELVSGYGGVIIQNCLIRNEPVTILYGHVLAPESIEAGSELETGETFAKLADDKSYYSGQERKHLHLSVHKGQDIEYRGYVQNKSGLTNWIDPEILLNSE